MRVVNDTRHEPIGVSGGRQIDAVVRVRGLHTGLRGISFEQHEPQAIIVRGEDDVRRVALPERRSYVAAGSVPLALYLLTRALIDRRRSR